MSLGKTEAGREKIRHDQLEEVEKNPREGLTVHLHPNKTLRNGSPAPCWSREVRLTLKGEAEEQKCRPVEG